MALKAGKTLVWTDNFNFLIIKEKLKILILSPPSKRHKFSSTYTQIHKKRH